MQMDAGMDTGPILLQSSLAIDPTETAAALSPRLAQAGADLLIKTLEKLKEGTLIPIPQDSTRATLAPLLKKEDGKIQWDEEASSIFNRWRGMAPWPGSTTYWGGERLKVLAVEMGSPEGRWGTPGEVLRLSEIGLEVAAGMGYILIERLQPEGGKSMTPKQYAAGRQIQNGSILTSSGGDNT